MIKRYLGTIAARFLREAMQHHEGQLREIAAFDVLQFNLQRVGYDALLFPGGYAANATLLLDIFRVLEELQPKTVLECGSGESTGILAHYARRHSGSAVVSLEDQPTWSARIRQRFLSDTCPENFELITAPLDTVTDDAGAPRTWYTGADVDRVLSNRRFELIVIDGPSGRTGAGRAGFLPYFPDLIAEQFVLYFDDANSALYQSDIEAIEATLKSHNCEFVRKNLAGEKLVAIIVSPDLMDIVGGRLP